MNGTLRAETEDADDSVASGGDQRADLNLPRGRGKTGAGMANRNGAGRMTPQHLADKAVRTFRSRLRPYERPASRAGRPRAL